MATNQNILIDTFGRVHDYLRISLTERCNLRCVYCMPENGIELRENSAYMNKHELLSIAKTFVDLGVKKIRLTGGEPLVRKDAAEIISELAKLPVELAISTNGILIDKFVDVFHKANIKSINISLDTLQKDKFNKIARRDDFEKVMSNIQLLLQDKVHVKLNAVLMKGENDDELIDFIEFTKDKNVHFRFIEFMPFDGNKWDWSKGVSLQEILDKLENVYGNKVIKLQDGKNDTAKSYAIEGYIGTFAVISSITNPFCDSCNRIRLTADGKVKNCLFSNDENDLLAAFRAGEDITSLIMDSINKKKFKRAGMDSFEDISNPKINSNNRPMISIGG